jgi:hypothetical protein
MQVMETVEGCPSFVKREMNGEAINWWSPSRTGDYLVDYLAGGQLFACTIDMLTRRDMSRADFYRSIMPPMNDDPRVILVMIIEAMEIGGPVERGFLDALAAKSIHGTLSAGSCILEESADEKIGEDVAKACLEVGYSSKAHDFIGEEMIDIVDRVSANPGDRAFVWTICAAALAGALH